MHLKSLHSWVISQPVPLHIMFNIIYIFISVKQRFETIDCLTITERHFEKQFYQNKLQKLPLGSFLLQDMDQSSRDFKKYW